MITLHVHVTNGRAPEQVLETSVEGDRDGELELIVPRDVYDELVRGDLVLSVGYMQGRVKVVGSSGLLMDSLVALDAHRFT